MGSDEVNFPHWTALFSCTLADGGTYTLPVVAPTRDAAIFMATCELCHLRGFHHGEWARETKENWILESVVMTDAHCCSCNSAGQCNLCGQDHHGSNCADGNHTESCMRVYDYHATVIQKATRDEEQAIMEAQDARKASGAPMTIRKGQRVFFKPEWQDPGDSNIAFIAVEDSNRGRIVVEAQLGLPINPQQTVTLDMVERAEEPLVFYINGKGHLLR